MSRAWKLLPLLFVLFLILVACGETTEEHAVKGIKVADEIFHQTSKAHNEEVDGVKLYKPIGFEVDDNSDAQNIVLNKGKQPFILFINPNEAKDSQLFYDLLQADDHSDLLAEEKFSDGNTFGFAAVIQYDEDTVELIANVGGAKMTTQTSGKNINKDLEVMMQIVRSIH